MCVDYFHVKWLLSPFNEIEGYEISEKIATNRVLGAKERFPDVNF